MKYTFAILAVLTVTAGLRAEDGLVGYWRFNEGEGTILHDASGNKNDGRIHGARWVDEGDGGALSFDGWASYVDCGGGESLNVRGGVTVSAWVRPDGLTNRDALIAGRSLDAYAITAYRGGFWWYTAGGGNNVSTPFDVLHWQHVVGVFDGKYLHIYHNGIERQRKPSNAPAPGDAGHFLMGRISQEGAPGPEYHFGGLIDEVKVYNRALSAKEVAEEYNRLAEKMGLEPTDPALADGVGLSVFSYPSKNLVVAQVAYPCIEPGTRIKVDLLDANEQLVAADGVTAGDSVTGVAEVSFPIPEDATGRFAVRAAVEGNTAAVPVKKSFDYRPEPAPLPSAKAAVVPPLPPKRPEPLFDWTIAPGGGLVVTVGDDAYTVESTYSFPHGGENRLAAGDPAGDEAQWKVAVDQENATVVAEGRFYSLCRKIERQPHRIVVRDTLTNKTNDVLGIILDNRIGLFPAPRSFYGPGNGTIYVASARSGLAMIALDDVYRLQQQSARRGEWGSMYTERFGLDAGASYTIEWDLYPTAENDYLEFINRVRRVEGLNRCVEGGFGLVCGGLEDSGDRRTPPDPRQIEAKGLKYASFFYLKSPEDDPGMSLEGFEFPDYPKECALLKQTTAESHRLNPGLKCMFHIAHGLFITHEPEKRFPDSRVIKADGKQLIYGPDSPAYYTQYISREKFDQGNRWWIFYPTLENSFGRRMLEGTDFMLDEIGTGGMYADGFVCGYAQGYTYDIWDGHSVEIDPQAKTVSRKIGNVTYLSLPVLKEVARKIAAKGGVLITNGTAGPRSLWEESYITTCESSGGDAQPVTDLYLGPAVTLFGDPTRIHDRRTLYLDVLDKIQYGALYFYYGDKNYAIEEPLIVRHMYPFTLEELGRGWMKGTERIITRKPGVYGWEKDNHLHRVFRSDGRGVLVENDDFSTADSEGVRTEVRLGRLESAVVEKLPVRAVASKPVNFLVARFDEECVEILVSDETGISFEKDPGYQGRIDVRVAGK